MSKTANIKIIKRRDLSNQSTKPKTKHHNRISKAQTERLLAISILDWVRERRERHRSEEIRNSRNFFGSFDALQSAI